VLKKLKTTKEKRDFIERTAYVHQCDRNCATECNWEQVPKLNLLFKLDLF
jgi:hypothetical protein